jgi:hypothetical protein
MAVLTPDGPGAGGLLGAAIARALRGLRFGSIEITVHDGRITLIERREKIRLDEERISAHGLADPIGPPKDRRGPALNHDDEDPTGRPEAPPMERARDATRNPDGSSDPDADPDDGMAGLAGDAGRRARSPGAAGGGTDAPASGGGSPGVPSSGAGGRRGAGD